MAGKFAEILSLDRVGALDNFFEIGGTSLSATKVVMYALTKGYNIVYKDVFENPSPRALAAFIGGETKVNEGKVKATEYDYSVVNSVLKKNIFESVDDIKPVELGNIVLTGATGFFCIHALKGFLDNYSGKVYCLIRRGMQENCENRMKNMLMYYFESTFDEYFGDRIICIEGDITEKETLEAVKTTEAGTVINCAACVKRFVNDDILDYCGALLPCAIAAVMLAKAPVLDISVSREIAEAVKVPQAIIEFCKGKIDSVKATQIAVAAEEMTVNIKKYKTKALLHIKQRFLLLRNIPFQIKHPRHSVLNAQIIHGL